MGTRTDGPAARESGASAARLIASARRRMSIAADVRCVITPRMLDFQE
jgi:hypothetical protein